MQHNNAFEDLIASGFSVRPAKIEDLKKAVPMFNAAEAELNGSGSWTVERYTEEWRQTGIDLDSSTRLVIEPGGAVVGCVELWDMFNPPVRPWIWGRVHPDWQGRGIGSALLKWALDTSHRALKRLSDDVRLAPHTAAPAHHKASIGLFESFGMQVTRYTWRMVKDLDTETAEPQWPAGIQVRNLRYPVDIRLVYEVEDEAFQEHWGYIKGDQEENFARWKSYTFEAKKMDPKLWFLALDGEKIVGTINAQQASDLDPDMGWIETLGVLKPYRHKGLGQALLQRAFQALERSGVRKVGLGVDAKNKTGATRLYERVGMRPDQETVHYEIELRPGRELAVVE